MGDGLVDLPAAGQGEAEVVVGLGETGVDFQGLPVMGDGLVDLSAAEPRPRQGCSGHGDCHGRFATVSCQIVRADR